MDEEDDDFGGFEAAEPMPNVEQAEGLAAQWAVFPGGPDLVGAVHRPDILCVDNRIPELVHSTNHRNPDLNEHGQQPDIQQAANGPEHFQADFNQRFLPEDRDDVNLDDIALANDILDGSFNNGAASSVGATPSQPHLSVPDIAGHGMLPQGQVPATARAVREVRDESGTESVAHQASGSVVDNFSRTREVARVNPDNGNQSIAPVVEGGAVGAIGDVGGDLKTGCVGKNGSLDSFVQGSKPQVTHELQSESRAESQLVRPKEQNISSNASKQRATNNIEDFQKGSNSAMQEVVDQYKYLVQTSLLDHSQSTEKMVLLKLQEQNVQLKETLAEQEQRNEEVLKRMREEMQLDSAEQSKKMSEEQQGRLEEMLANKQQSHEKQLSELMKQEKEQFEERLQDALKKEQETSKAALKEQESRHKEMMRQLIEEHQAELRRILKEEREKSLEMVKDAVEKERQFSAERSHILQMESDNRVQLSRTLQQRQLASLDVFLEGARQQLSLLMQNSQVPADLPENSFSVNQAKVDNSGLAEVSDLPSQDNEDEEPT